MLKNSGIPDAIAEAMIQRGYEKLTPVQEEVIKKDYSGLDLLVSAQTGSGKTIAFGFSIVENILGKENYFKKHILDFVPLMWDTTLVLVLHRTLRGYFPSKSIPENEIVPYICMSLFPCTNTLPAAQLFVNFSPSPDLTMII